MGNQVTSIVCHYIIKVGYETESPDTHCTEITLPCE